MEAEWRIYASVNYTIMVSDDGLSPGRHQAIIWTNAGILLGEHSGTNSSEIIIEIEIFSFTNLHLKVSSAKVAGILSRPQCVKQQFKDEWRTGGIHNRISQGIEMCELLSTILTTSGAASNENVMKMTRYPDIRCNGCMVWKRTRNGMSFWQFFSGGRLNVVDTILYIVIACFKTALKLL